MRLLLITLAAIFIATGCQKKEEKVIENKAILLSGPSSFGHIIVGDAMTTKIKLINSTSSPESGMHNINAPFLIRSKTPSNCSIEIVEPNSECELVIEFSPLSTGNYQMQIDFMGETIVVKGSGVVSGTLSLETNEIVFSTLKAGAESTYNIQVTNIGGTDFWLNNLPDTGQARAEKGSCSDVILPGKSCFILITFTPKYASQEFSHEISLSENIEAKLTFKGIIEAGAPAGNIDIIFTSTMASNSQQTVYSGVVRDEYGNQVTAGTTLNISVGDKFSLNSNRSTAEIDRLGTATIGSDGKVSFIIYSTAVASPATSSVYVAYPDSTAFGTVDIIINP